MKKIYMSALLVGLAMPATLFASEFDGPYLGINVGNNRSSVTSLSDKDSGYLGLKAGYNWDLNGFLLGAEGFVDGHSDSYTNQDSGLDLRFGIPLNLWLIYAKLGLVGTDPGTRAHGGLGVEYSLTKRWSVNAEWTTDSKDDAGSTFKNNNMAIGLNYHFGGEPAKAAPVAAVASPVVVANPPVEKVVAAPVYKTVLLDKLITLEGSSFASGSAKLNPSAGAQLDKGVEFAAKYQNTNLVVTGYTDDRGDAKKNLQLSAARAEAVKSYLVKHGVAADRISTKGEGEASPIADNKTAEGRAKNRRVEITSVVKEEKKVLVQ